MKGLGRVVGLTMLLVYFLCAKTYPSTSKVQTYVSKGGLTFRQAQGGEQGRTVSSPKFGRSELLFAQQMEDSIREERADSMILKDPNKAIFYAFIPGVVVHGYGHFYAGKTKTGFWLLGAEVVGAYLVFTAALAEFPGGEYDPDDELWGFAGLLLFVGSWVYDVVKSPMIVKKQNEELLQRRHSKLELQVTDESLKLVIKWRF